MLRPIHDSILFVFLDEVVGGFFREKTSWGLQIIPGKDNQTKKGRWAKVLAIGPEVKDVEVGNFICIEPMMWTEGVTFDGIRVWRTAEPKVMLVSETQPTSQ